MKSLPMSEIHASRLTNLLTAATNRAERLAALLRDIEVLYPMICDPDKSDWVSDARYRTDDIRRAAQLVRDAADQETAKRLLAEFRAAR